MKRSMKSRNRRIKRKKEVINNELGNAEEYEEIRRTKEIEYKNMKNKKKGIKSTTRIKVKQISGRKSE